MKNVSIGTGVKHRIKITNARTATILRFESKGAAFHARLRDGFRAIAEAEPERCVIVDAGGSMDEVTEAVWAAVAGRLAVHG